MATDNTTGLLQIMNIDSWITLAAVLVALGIGVASILQTQNLQKRERRERLLNEIIEWAVDVASSFEPTDTPDLSDDKDAAKSWPFLANQREKLNSLQLLGARSLAMGIIAEKINPKRKVVVGNASKKLENQQGFLWEFKRWEDTRSKKEGVATEFLRQMAVKVAQNNNELYGSALEVIRDATDLRGEVG